MNSSEQPQVVGAQPQMVAALMPWFMGGPWVPKFSGEGGASKFLEWKTQIEAFIQAQGLNVEQRVDFVLSAFEANAKREVVLLAADKRDTDIKILEALSELYGVQQPVAQLRVQFFNCKQEPGEGVRDFILHLRELHYRWRAKDPLDAGTDDELLRTQFAMGLRTGSLKQELQRQLRRTSTLTFAEACEEAKALERELGHTEEANVCPTVAATSYPRPTPTVTELQQMKEALRAELREELKEQVTLLGKSVVDELQGRLKSLPEMETSPQPSWQSQSNAPQRQRLGSAPPGQSYYQWDAQGQAICRDCGDAGHIQRFCPRRRPAQTGFRHPRSQQGK